MTPIFDPAAHRQKQARARALNGDRFLDIAAAEGLADRLAAVTRRFERGLWIGPASGGEPSNSPVPEAIAPFAAHWSALDFDCDERLAPDGPFDLAVSLYSLQAITDLPGALIQIRHALKPDGLFLAALLAGDSLSELRQAFAFAESETKGGLSPRVSPFADVRALGGLLQRAGFALPVADSEKLAVLYRGFDGVVRDLRAHGLTNSLHGRARGALRRDTLAAMLGHYTRHNSHDGKLKAMFETVYLTGWAPHESQQKPLQPGSARARLADALGATEEIISDRSTPTRRTP